MIVIADIHGRTFWKDVIKGYEEEKTIFLGDYLDPYPDEWTDEIYLVREDAIENFKEILEFKKSHMDNVILLVGNHDLEYMVSTNICNCRRDNDHYMEIRNLFRDNKDLFKICYKEGNVVYSHGGIRSEWIETITSDIDENDIVDWLNTQFEEMMSVSFPEEMTFAENLANCSFYRGGWDNYSSLVWGDIREWINRNPRPYTFYQVFGHTRLNGNMPFVTKDWACLDCSQGFKVDDNGVVITMDNISVDIIDPFGDEE